MVTLNCNYDRMVVLIISLFVVVASSKTAALPANIFVSPPMHDNSNTNYDIETPFTVAMQAPPLMSLLPHKKPISFFKNTTKISNKINARLIGIFGKAPKRRALFQYKNGKYKRILIGKKINGWLVHNITINNVTLKKGDQVQNLSIQ